MKCLICKKEEAKIKYCSNKCAYIAINQKQKERNAKRKVPKLHINYLTSSLFTAFLVGLVVGWYLTSN